MSSTTPAYGPPIVAIVGGGQLAKMLGVSALRLGLRCRCLAARADDACRDLGEVLVGDPGDPESLRRLAAGAAVVTFDHEWADAEALESALHGGAPVRPSGQTLFAIADKRRQRELLARADLPQPEHLAAIDVESVREFAARHGDRVVVKRARGGYDGIGVVTAEGGDEIRRAVEAMDGGDGVLVEQWVPYVRELAVCVVRGVDGATVAYAPVESSNTDQRCAVVIAPARITSEVSRRATDVAVAAAELFDCIGACTVELFELADGSVLVNEVSPRVHNTAHWTIEGAVTCQFENHIRAILGWPLGDPSLRAPTAVMVNVFGMEDGVDPASRLREALEVAGAQIHLYGKHPPRPGRKLGHVTACGDDLSRSLTIATKAANILMGVKMEESHASRDLRR